jgi:uncharacterized protein YrrD
MLHSVKGLRGYKLGALDGEIGRVEDFYFDDKDWVVRYVVAGTGSRISGREALISPYAIDRVQTDEKILRVNLTREKVKQSPPIEAHLPVGRRRELEYYKYYDWPVYWGGPALWGLYPVPVVPPVTPSRPESKLPETPADPADTRLRGTRKITGYLLQAPDGEIGRVEDFLVDDRNWAICDLVVSTGHWWSGRHVLVPPRAISSVSWEESKIFVKLTRAEIQREPEYQRSTI